MFLDVIQKKSTTYFNQLAPQNVKDFYQKEQEVLPILKNKTKREIEIENTRTLEDTKLLNELIKEEQAIEITINVLAVISFNVAELRNQAKDLTGRIEKLHLLEISDNSMASHIEKAKEKKLILEEYLDSKGVIHSIAKAGVGQPIDILAYNYYEKHVIKTPSQVEKLRKQLISTKISNTTEK